jgi:ElaB/YqjD/DUF883 family membrane-anchored ribosome-binding protein
VEKFAIGLVIGGLGGAMLVANNYKMRTLIKKGQAEVQAKLDKLMDEKIEEMDEALESAKAQAKNVAENVQEKAEDTVDDVKSKTRKLLRNKESAEA